MSEILLEQNASLLTLTINREAQLNALNSAVIAELRQTVESIAERIGSLQVDSPRVLLIRGSGSKAFVAGADIKEMQSLTPSEMQNFVTAGQELMNSIQALPIPVVAVIQGYALGGGLELALACDLIVASSKARLGLPEVKLGLIPGFGGTQRLTARVGLGAARRLILSGEDIGAEDAYRLGLVDYKCEPDVMEETTTSVLRSLLARSPAALAAAKRAANSFYQVNQRDGLAVERAEFVQLAGGTEAVEGMRAFLAKQTPKFAVNMK